MIPTVLVVEDDPNVATAISNLLEKQGCRVAVSPTTQQAMSKLSKQSYDLSLIDWGTSDSDGLQFIEFANNNHYPMKTVLLSERTNTKYRIEGLRAGASDYLTKPFSYQELELRVKKLLLSDKRVSTQLLQYRNLGLEPNTGEIIVSGVRKHLRRKEAEILACLMRHQKQVVTRDMLIQYIWGDEYLAPDFRTIDVYVRRIRQVLDSKEAQIETVRSFGFRLQ